MASVNIYDAKTQFSKLVKRVRAGEEIIIADAGVPVAKLVPIERPKQPRILGGYEGKVWMADDIWAPMTPEELSEWYDNPIFPDEPTSTESAAAPAAKKRRFPAKPAAKSKVQAKTKARTKTKSSRAKR